MGVVALSEGLRPELVPRGIGVSVLCPGFIRTQIINSRRNLPKRFEGAVPALPTSGPLAEQINMIRERVSQGIDPIYVGELVREGVEKDWPYIFTDLEFEPMIEARLPQSSKALTRSAGATQSVERAALPPALAAKTNIRIGLKPASKPLRSGPPMSQLGQKATSAWSAPLMVDSFRRRF
jgi:NAD(P)-dependent dehydrogenase (short-subunit alcohol dehydrogenase family)